MTRKKRATKFTVIVFRDQSSFIARRGMKDFFFRGRVGGSHDFRGNERESVIDNRV